jgi:hypothetical protein
LASKFFQKPSTKPESPQIKQEQHSTLRAAGLPGPEESSREMSEVSVSQTLRDQPGEDQLGRTYAELTASYFTRKEQYKKSFSKLNL